MLVCSVSLRAPRRAIAAHIAEAAVALDASTTGFVVFATLVDDPANVRDFVDAYLGEIMLEAASAADAADAGLSLDTAITEAASAADTSTATVSAAVTTWSPSDKSSNITLSNGNLSAQSTNTTNGAVRSTISISSGRKAYFEFIWGGTLAGLNTMCGIANSAAVLGSVGNTGVNAIMIAQSNGTFWYNGSNIGSIGALSVGTVVCIAVDLVNNRFWARQGAGNWNNNAANDPATNVGGLNISTVFATNPAFACVSFNSSTPIMNVNFGGTTFVQAIPSGFTAWG